MRIIGTICFLCIVASNFCSAGELPDFHSTTMGKVGYPDNDATSKEPVSSLFAKFLTPPPGYGEVPFYWFPGDKLTRERLTWQLDLLTGKTLPGVKPEEMPKDYPMPRIGGIQVNTAHARGSQDGKRFGSFGTSYVLDPPLFTPEFWELWAWLVKEGDRRDIGVGMSDYCLAWPGQGYIVDDVVSDPARQGKSLKWKKRRVAKGSSSAKDSSFANPIATVDRPVPDNENAIDRYDFYWEPKPFSIDMMDKEAGALIADRFFGETERNAPEQHRKSLNFYFQDEFKTGISGLVWTPDFADEFQKRKGYDIKAHLPHLFEKIDDTTPKIRLDYHDVMMDLSEERYFKAMCGWHNSRGMLYGCDQVSRGKSPMMYGDYFRAIRWFSAPGHDTPGKGADIIKGKVSSSISHLYGSPRVWLEGYHSAGWGMTLERLTRTTNENYAVGCNLLCLHGLYYTTHGGFWEWAPPCYHFRMPYWRHTGVWLRYFERLSFLLSHGKHVADVAIVYPVEQGAAGFDCDYSTKVAFSLGGGLYQRGIDFDFIDGQSIARSTINDKKMNVSGESYRVLVLPAMKALRWDAIEKIRDFYRGGGIVVALECPVEASDRVGANDPELRQIMNEIFGEKETTDAEGGKGYLYTEAGQAAPPRVYDNGFKGRWVWSDKASQNVAFKAVWNQGKQRVKFRFLADNYGEFYVNGKPVAPKGQQTDGEIDLDDGDVLVALCRDKEAAGGKTAGFFFAAVVDEKTVFSAEDFQCSTRPADFADDVWRRSDKTEGLEAISQKYVHQTHVSASKKSATPHVDFVNEIVSKNVVRDFEVEGGAWVLHRTIATNEGNIDVFFVQHAEKDAWATFRASGEVQLWDAWNGKAFRLTEIEHLSDGRTRVRLPLEKQEGRIIAFVPAGAGGDHVTDYRRYLEDASPETIKGDWEFELMPTMDNRFGDFRLPIEKNPFDDSFMLGAEARRFKTRRIAPESSNPKFAAPEFDDSSWSNVTYGYGDQMFVYNVGKGKAANAAAEIESTLLDGKTPESIGDSKRQNYRFSWRSGVEDNPGDQRAWHGLKEIVLDEFLIVPEGTTYFSAWISLPEASTVFMDHPEDLKPAPTMPEGKVAPSAVWIDGRKAESETTLQAGAHRVVIKYEKPGRSYVVFSTKKEEVPTSRTPLAMKWFDCPSTLRFSPLPNRDEEQWFRFISPPGLAALAFKPVGECRVFVNGKEIRRLSSSDAGKTVSVEVPEAERVKETSTVAIQVRNAPWGVGDGAVFSDPIRLRCERGTISLGDWATKGVLETYSGGAWYRKKISMTDKEIQERKSSNGRILLDLGHVTASCEVRINGTLASVMATSPWRCDITSLLVPGENEVSVLVMNTLANHYQTIPSNYRGETQSGLFGPVKILREKTP